jgi:vacuolar-type H+-ATPase subunit E/Vma4
LETNTIPLSSRLARRRIENAVADRGSALALGAVLLVTAAAYVLGVRGLVAPAAWQAGLAAGGAFVLLRAILGLATQRDDPNLLRDVLTTHFGEEIRADPDVTRLSRQAIEQRLQLSAAQVEAPRPLAKVIDGMLPALNQRLDLIAAEARAAASGRGAARFQAGMAQLAQQRLTEVSRIAKAADTDRAALARKAADGLTAQVAASGGVVAEAEDRLIVLDQAVADFSTAVARALLALSKGDRDGLAALARDLAQTGDPGRI